MRRFSWLPAYGGLTMALIIWVGAVAPSHAADQPVVMRFAIPAQPLATALIAFGKQANVQVLTAGDAIMALRSSDATGTFTVKAELARLLRGSGMVYAFVDARTVIVKPRAPAPATAVKIPRPAQQNPATLLPAVHAIGLVGRDVGFMGDVSSGPARTISDPIDVPQSVGIVTHDLLQSQQIQTIADAVQNVAGVQYFDGSSGLPIFQIRGFYTGNGMTDGLPNSVAGIGDFPPPLAVQRVEVLKGPQAILGDASANDNFGGLINIVLKKPQSEPVRQFTFALGQNGESQAGLDLAGPLGGSKTLAYRLVLNGNYANHTVQGYRSLRNRYVAPSIGWTTDRTSLVVGLSWMMNHMPIPDHTLLLDNTVSSSSPAGIRLGNPGEHTAIERRRVYYMLDHRFDDVWTFRSRAQYVREAAYEQDWSMSNIRPTGDVTATAEDYRYSDAYYALQNDVIGSFGRGWLQYNLVLGFDYSRAQVGSGFDALSNGGNGMPYNIFTGPSLPPPRSALVPDDYDNGYIPGSPWSTQSGVFFQNQFALGDHWDVLLAWRRAVYELQTTHADGTPWNQYKVHWVPNYGLVYKFNQDVSLYANTTNGFQPDIFLSKTGRPLPLALSRQIEAGAKFDLFGNKARLTVAGYRIMLDHSYDLISLQPPYFAISGPGQSNSGVEVEFNGRIAPGMDISASYTSAIVRNNDGSSPIGAPRQRFNLWASYAIQGGALRGWGVAGGVLARSRSTGLTSDGNTAISIPGQASVAANVFYRTLRWSMTLGVKNLLDRNLHGAYFDETFVPLHNRRTYLLSGTVDF